MTADPNTPGAEVVLLPCPFCGGAAEMEPWHGGGPDKQMVCCSNQQFAAEHGGCDVGPMVTGETPAEAIAAWNRRAPAAPPAAGAEVMDRGALVEARLWRR